MTLKLEDLRGARLRTFEMWRSVGLSESAALGEVARAHPELTEPFDAVAASFRALGMSESAARTAAVGRDGSESAARKQLSDSLKPGSGLSIAERFARLEEALAACSDEDLRVISTAANRRAARKSPAPSRKITETPGR